MKYVFITQIEKNGKYYSFDEKITDQGITYIPRRIYRTIQYISSL